MFAKNYTDQLFEEIIEPFFKKMKEYVCKPFSVGTSGLGAECHRQGREVRRTERWTNTLLVLVLRFVDKQKNTEFPQPCFSNKLTKCILKTLMIWS